MAGQHGVSVCEAAQQHAPHPAGLRSGDRRLSVRQAEQGVGQVEHQPGRGRHAPAVCSFVTAGQSMGCERASSATSSTRGSPCAAI